MPRYSEDEASFVRSPLPGYMPLSATSVPAASAVLIAPASTVVQPSGDVFLFNTSATVTLTFSPYGTATATDIPLLPNTSIRLAPGMYGISVYNPSASAVTIRGYRS